MSHMDFQIGFWHPFGPHSTESAEQILVRKAKEIEANEWTLWSFQHRPMLDDWHRQLTLAAPNRVLVFCSAGGGKDPITRGSLAQAVDCQSYRFVGDKEWYPMPAQIRVPHTFPLGKGQASAFVVRRIIHPAESFVPPVVEWLSQAGEWRQGFQQRKRWCPGIPTRGEYLIRPGGTGPIRGVRVILELRPPYLAVVRTEPAESSPAADRAGRTAFRGV
jgi:hypothetical protein